MIYDFHQDIGYLALAFYALLCLLLLSMIIWLGTMLVKSLRGKSINKIEAVLLFARVAGYADANNEKIVELANDKYAALLDEIDLGAYDNYKKEIAFLLYKNVLDAGSLEEYLGDSKYLDEFPRSDAAILIANLMGADVKGYSSSSLDFDDAKQIPSDAVKYVAYVVNEGLMNGVQKDDGTVVFDAEKALSRAQVCVLLYRIIDKLNISAEAGIVDLFDAESGVLEFTNAEGRAKSYVLDENVKVIINGENAKASDILSNSDIVVVRHGKDIYSVDVISPSSDVTVKGVINDIAKSSTYAKITITESVTDAVKTFYSKGTDFEVTTDGVKDRFESIKAKDYVVIKLLGSDIVSIDRQTAEATVQGTIVSINFTSPVGLTVRTVDEITEEEAVSDYTVSDSAVIRRNSKSVTLREILAGDKVVLTITRGEITKIIATSTSGNVTGTVTAIKIAAQSEITVAVNSVEKVYSVAMDATYKVAGSDATIYDLRLGNLVTLTLSGTTATKIEQTSASTATTKTGIVESTSSSYGYINIVSLDGGAASEQIFAAKTGANISAKILNGETGKEILFKNLKKGDTIIATGAYSNGAFVAKTIVVTPAAE